LRNLLRSIITEHALNFLQVLPTGIPVPVAGICEKALVMFGDYRTS